MKVERVGPNTYRKASWYKRHEREIWLVMCAIMGMAVFFMALLIRG